EELIARPRAARGVIRKAVGVQRIVLEISKARAVQLIGAGFDGEVGHAGLAAVVLGADGAGLELEFAHRLRAGAELVVAAALEIEPAQREAFNENLMGVELPAIDRSLERAAHRAGQAVEDEFLN